MDWYSETFVLPLLYPTPTRHCIFVLLRTSQLSAFSGELKTSEPGLCYVCLKCPAPWCPGPVQNCQVVPYEPDFSDMLPWLMLTTLPPLLLISMGCFGWEQLRIAGHAFFQCNCAPEQCRKIFKSLWNSDWYGRMCLNSTANNHLGTSSVDVKQPGSKT